MTVNKCEGERNVSPNIIFNKAIQRIMLIVGMFFYYVYDLISTWYGLANGWQELNPIAKTFPEIMFVKTIAVIVFLSIIKLLWENNKQHCKYYNAIIIYFILIAGLVAFINNTYVILWR